MEDFPLPNRKPLAKRRSSRQTSGMVSHSGILLIDELEPTAEEISERESRPLPAPDLPVGLQPMERRVEVRTTESLALDFEAAVRCFGWEHPAEAIRAWMNRMSIAAQELRPEQFKLAREFSEKRRDKLETKRQLKVKAQARAAKQKRLREDPENFTDHAPKIPSNS